MILILPYTHEARRMRRWPVVTAAITLCCLIVHAFWFAQLKTEEREIEEIEARINAQRIMLFMKHSVGSAGGFGQMIDQIEPSGLNDILYGVDARIDLFMVELHRNPFFTVTTVELSNQFGAGAGWSLNETSIPP